MTQRLQIMEDWSNILGVGTIGNLINVIAEGNSEIARYLEYLYNEKKWRNARNMSSLTHQADLISYKRQLPKSAIGYVIVSHTDLNNIERLLNFGVTFFDLDQASDFDELSQNLTATFTERQALVPWTSDVNYVIPQGSIFKTPKGTSFFAIETVEARALKEPFSAIKTNPVKYADFIRAGGWNGIKYLKVPVIQGEKVEVEFGRAKGRRFESFAIEAIDVENASNIISEKFFKVKVTPELIINGLSTDQPTEIWEKIANIRLAGPYDKVFEAKILNDEDRVLLKFGDGITGQMLPVNAKVNVEYLETKGESGNVPERFQITQMVLPPGFNQVDPRFNVQTQFLGCTNIAPIMGGRNIEEEEDIRLNAPPTYLQSYAIATKGSYYEQIMKNSPVSLLHCRLFQSGVYSTQSYGNSQRLDADGSNMYVSNIEGSVLQEISMNKNALLITAIRSNGEKLTDPYNELVEPLIKAFQDVKSPNDSFDYIEPNMIEIRPNIIINTNETLTENEIQNNIMPSVLSKYSIFNTKFEQPYYKSDIIDIAQDFSFNKYSEVFLEAKVKASNTPIMLRRESDPRKAILQPETLLAFSFQFDKIFAQNQLNAGFRNFKVKAPYVIRADILFREDPTKNRSLFLLDERTELQNTKTLLESEENAIDGTIQVPLLDTKATFTYAEFEKVTFYDEISEFFYNRQVRTAQFNYIDRITSRSYFHQMKQFNIEPYEIRPLYVDELGRNKIFNVAEVPESEKVSLNFSDNVVGQQCFRKNLQYINQCKLIFNENYEDPNSALYANGYLILPLNYVFEKEQRDNLYDSFEHTLDDNRMAYEMGQLLNEQFVINVYAIPMEEKFECNEPFDIIYSNRNNILIQKNYLKSVN